MDPMIKHCVGLWDSLDSNFWGFWQWVAAHLSPDEVGWQPVPQVASIGWNLQHLGEMLDYYLTYVFRQPGPVREVLPTMQSGSQDDGWFRDLAAIAAYHHQVRPAFRNFLLSLRGADLDRAIERHGRGSITYAWSIGHIAEHESYHLGKCTLLRSLLLARRARE